MNIKEMRYRCDNCGKAMTTNQNPVFCHICCLQCKESFRQAEKARISEMLEKWFGNNEYEKAKFAWSLFM